MKNRASKVGQTMIDLISLAFKQFQQLLLWRSFIWTMILVVSLCKLYVCLFLATIRVCDLSRLIGYMRKKFLFFLTPRYATK